MAGVTYKDAGVNINANNEANERIKKHVRSTFNESVLADAGHFGGALSAAKLKEYNEPVLITSIDGVGTKLMIAKMMNKWDTVGFDIVSHSANDILAVGAEPFFFTDYIASAKLEPVIVELVVKGLAQACKENNIPLIAGETAEMPGVYCQGELDLVGSITGIGEKSKLIDGSSTKEGDILLALPSNGLHTNGYSLARKVMFEIAGYTIHSAPEELGGTSVGEELLKPHKSYVSEVQPLVKEGLLKGIAHITGGGLIDNVPRIIPEGLGAKIKKSKINILPIFKLIQEKGDVPEDDMWRTFNMGVGLVLVTAPETVEKIKEKIPNAYEIGTVAQGSEVEFI